MSKSAPSSPYPHSNAPEDPYQGFPTEPWYPDYTPAGTIQEVGLPLQKVICHSCGIEGHKSPNCPLRKPYFYLMKKLICFKSHLHQMRKDWTQGPFLQGEKAKGSAAIQKGTRKWPKRKSGSAINLHCKCQLED